MELLRRLARDSQARLFRALLASGCGGLGGALLVALINHSLEAPPAQIGRLGLAFAGVTVATLGLRGFSQAEFVRLKQATQARLRLDVCKRIVDAPYRELELQGPARLLAVLIADINTVTEFFTTLPRLATQGAVVFGCLVYLGFLSWRAAAFALAMMAAGSTIHYAVVRRGNDQLRRARLAEDQLFHHLRALLVGAKELRLHHARREVFLSEVLAGSLEAVRKRRTRGLSIYVFAGSWGAFLFFVVIGGVVFVLGSVMDVELGVRSGYALTFLYMMHPLEGVLEGIPDIHRTRVALAQIDAATAHERAISTTASPLAPCLSVGLHEVTHAYRREGEKGTFVLGPVSLELRPGELVFLTGGNGSGKTTLAKLLVGLYEPESGQVRSNGVAVERGAREGYREHFSTVFSDFHLFESLLGMEGRERLERASHLLGAFGLAHRVTVQDGVFSTRDLSRGQQKRLALLVAFLEDRPVYVFDEWAADQDPVYKEVFYRQILPELKARGKAVLVITHDDRYFEVADRCLKLDAGRLVPAALAPSHPPREVRAGMLLPEPSA